ncbi:hypothetical protein D621_11175 [beta proteobacterium AAP51]|nr:hypothetical protein D621_11175 [beta proteobacterium AAP51]
MTQGPANSLASTFGPNAQLLPALGATPADTLATVPALWGWRRELWRAPAPGMATIAGVPVFPVQRLHPGATLGSEGVCALHFRMQGQALEVLLAGAPASITLLADGEVLAGGFFRTARAAGVPGAPLNAPNSFVRIDFGSAAPRQLSLYARSAQGPCALAVAADDSVQAWDRSAEATMAGMADSYGGYAGVLWAEGGPLWEAAARLGIPHLDLSAVGGTGYAPNSAPGFGNPGDAFAARLPSLTASRPDLVITAGGINDNNSLALPPYATAEAARQGFEAATHNYYSRLREALPEALLVAVGPWAPRESVPPDAVALSKADAIAAALAAAGGPWVFLDNLRGGWRCSSGASATGTGPWQTGTGRVGAPTGVGNGDTFVDRDGTHPTVAGVLHLGERIAEGVRAALATL